ncbi:hypothetical protein [Micrococcus sp.]|uniref:hypothetical protein n=1 Tax=Micrococcus sp. TaxID=1271 RepID=UPI0026DD53F2|nr:hypothetical protein [Micrococcus sp.]MDO4239116.1 hypothetical protein [Micrococcus sp.]
MDVLAVLTLTLAVIGAMGAAWRWGQLRQLGRGADGEVHILLAQVSVGVLLTQARLDGPAWDGLRIATLGCVAFAAFIGWRLQRGIEPARVRPEPRAPRG